MSADFNKPTVSSSYTTFPTEVRDNVSAVAKQDYSGASNIPTGTKRYNTSTKQIEQYNGSTWDAQEITNLADGAVSTAAKLASNVVTTAKILDSNVTTAKIADSNVTAAKIADGTITEVKLDDDAATRSAGLFVGVYNGMPQTSLGPASMGAHIAATAATFVALKRMPKAGKITHLSVATDASVTGGTITITLQKNGSSTGKTVVLSSGLTNSGAITAESFAAGDTIGLTITAASYTRASGVGNFIADAWGHFTA